MKKIWTIGHSTHSLHEFTEWLDAFSIEKLVDIRRFPGSNKFPHFNRDEFAKSLENKGIAYIYLEELGGRRKYNPDSIHTVWRNKSFRAYADYMDTEEFKKGIEKLENIAKEAKSVMMCSEAVWWRCHRSLVADVLKAKGWEVLHIMGINKAEEHPYTQPAKIKNNQVFYGSSDKDNETKK